MNTVKTIQDSVMDFAMKIEGDGKLAWLQNSNLVFFMVKNWRKSNLSPSLLPDHPQTPREHHSLPPLPPRTPDGEEYGWSWGGILAGQPTA